MTYGAKYGSYDVIGCGVTWAGCVFFTHNGLALPLRMTYLTGDIFAAVSIKGQNAQVRINFGWLDEWSLIHDFFVNFDKVYDDPKETVGVKDLKILALDSPSWSKKSTNFKTPSKYSSSKKLSDKH